MQNQQSPGENNAVIVASLVTNTFSIIGLFYIFYIILRTKYRKQEISQSIILVMYLCIANLLEIISKVPGIIVFFKNKNEIENYTLQNYSFQLCNFEGFIGIVGTIGSMGLTGLINFYIYQAIMKPQLNNFHKYQNFVEIIATVGVFWGVVTLSNLNIVSVQPNQQINCWIDVSNVWGKVTQSFIIILFVLVFFYQIFMIVKIVFYIKKVQKFSLIKYEHNKMIIIVVYPISFFICWFSLILEDTCSLFSPTQQVCGGILSDLNLPLIGANGFINAIIYGFLSIRLQSNQLYIPSDNTTNGPQETLLGTYNNNITISSVNQQTTQSINSRLDGIGSKKPSSQETQYSKKSQQTQFSNKKVNTSNFQNQLNLEKDKYQQKD